MRTPTPWTLPTQPITRADLLASGVSPRMIRTGLASGRLIAVRRGVFVGADSWPDDEPGHHIVAAYAEQTLHPDAVLSHESAALVWGLPTPGFSRWDDFPPSVTLPSGHALRNIGAVRHTASLPVSQVQRDEHGYDVTSPARTGVDLAVGRPLPEGLVLLDAASRLVIASLVGPHVRRRDYANPRLARAAVERLEQAASTIGAARLQPAIALVVPARESAAESLSAGHLHLAGVPTPQFQVEIRTPAGLVYPDFYWPEKLLVGEVDGAVKYRDARAYVLEKEREQLLRDLGYRIVRWLAKEILLRPAEVTARVARALDA